ncbi:MAG TPA: hypothetical protein VEY67_08060 [Candidatus Dormibacteraeota bacterium]|nr:hypothetical protein [Candidatus Dormibacteraeota bacterium]
MSQPHESPPAGPASLDDTSASSHLEPDGHTAEAGEHSHGDEHGHGDELGPIDWAAWGAGALGVVIGLATAFAFVVATNRLG